MDRARRQRRQRPGHARPRRLQFARRDRAARRSQFNLGVIYQQGRGVTADHAEALFWFLLAARHDDADAAARAAALEAELTPMQIEQARARAQAFRPRTSEPVANGMFDAPAAVAAAPGAPSPAEPAVQPAQTAAH
jgi:localization factor PodJL